MPLYLTKNPYQGVNAHFNSLLQQAEEGWDSFHHDHITHLKSAVNQVLPPSYYALSERTLQIRDSDDQWLGATRPDVGIFRRPETLANPSAQPFSTPTLEIPLADLEDETYSAALKIYHAESNRLVTRLEFISPKNKRHPEAYFALRDEMRQSGVHLIELDYLHEQPNLHPGILPDYSQGAAQAFPYSITLINQHTKLMSFYCFGVDEEMPILVLPLLGQDTFTLDFGSAYNVTFEDDRRAHLALDYATLPANFERYSPDDQTRIQTVMARLNP